MEIKKETTAKRCEICHQLDQFDAETGKCLRCDKIQVPSDEEKIDQQLSLIGFDKQEAEKKITSGVYAGTYLVISKLVIIILVIVSQQSAEPLQIDILNTIMIIPLGFFTLGVYGKKSRICSGMLLGFYVVNKILDIMDLHLSALKGWLVFLLVSYFLFQSFMATFDYHDALEKEKLLLSSRK